MEFVKKSKAKKFKSVPSTTVWEYEMKDEEINGAIAKINGRYPEKGRVVNEESKELVFVLEGKGRLVIEGKEIQFQKGDFLLILPGERYFWQGKMKIFMANTPKWKPDQHKFVNSL
ncbi:cupin domain-containing protein [Candidatus Microgenomates bacterium]|nr:cupin domain-containing protein [Candidatus Microgenomates bacterium]